MGRRRKRSAEIRGDSWENPGDGWLLIWSPAAKPNQGGRYIFIETISTFLALISGSKNRSLCTVITGGGGVHAARFMLDVPTTNRSLVHAAADPRNDEAWRQLYRIYSAPIAALCNASGLNPGEAEDVVQEVLLRLARRLARTALKPETVGLRAWLSQVTNQQIFDLYRRRRRNTLSPAASTLIQSWLPAALAPEVDTDARVQLEAHLWAVCLARVRHEVSPTHWQIFESYCLQGVSSPEVARVFGTTQINVRIIRKRVVGKIKEQWKRLAVEPLDMEE